MSLGHEKLDVYRLSIEYVAWVFTQANTRNGVHRHARDQWLRASQSIPLKSDRIATMLSKLGGRGYCIKEDQASYGEHYFDPDSDFESDNKKDEDVVDKLYKINE